MHYHASFPVGEPRNIKMCEVYVLCSCVKHNIRIYISFYRPIVCTTLNSIDVCCCNSGLATSLNEITTPFNIYLVNIAEVLVIEEVYCVCNGVLWCRYSVGCNEFYGAVPLCAIFAIQDSYCNNRWLKRLIKDKPIMIN